MDWDNLVFKGADEMVLLNMLPFYHCNAEMQTQISFYPVGNCLEAESSGLEFQTTRTLQIMCW